MNDTTAPICLVLDVPAVILAPMDGLTDAPMRAIQGEIGAFTFAVSEFLRVSSDVPPAKVFRRHVPELAHGGRTMTGLPVQVQLLGGDAGRMAQSAVKACQAGARAIDINFGCPAPTVNRHDGGATLLKHPARLREIVAAIRQAVPPEIPVSAKLRLGWDSPDAIYENAAMVAAGGADWITVHGRTRAQGYQPPALWGPMGVLREQLGIPIVANGDLWTVEDFRRCRDETGCVHFMLGRGALADPRLSHRIAAELGLPHGKMALNASLDWPCTLYRLVALTHSIEGKPTSADGKANRAMTGRLKQWIKLAARYGDFSQFDAVKEAATVEELFSLLTAARDSMPPVSSARS